MNNRFVNPYNFIPLQKKRAEEGKEEKTLTGVIEYSVLTKMPLFIPNTGNENVFPKYKEKVLQKKKQELQKETDAKKQLEDFQKSLEEHKMYDFFSYTDISKENQDYTIPYAMPVIPGSEIRGMLRSNYEILTNSCMSALNDDVILSKRTMQTFQAGLLCRQSDGNFQLYEAIDYLWRTKGEDSTIDEENWKEEYSHRKCYKQKDFPEGTKVYFVPSHRGNFKPLARNVTKKPNAQENAEGYVVKGNAEGYVIKGLDGPEMNKNQKHCCHIFRLRLETNKKAKKVQGTLSLEVLDKILEQYEINGRNIYKEYQEQFQKFKNGKLAEKETYFPVYYSKVSENTNYIMLSPACITREIQQNRLGKIVKSYAPCKGDTGLCPTCSLFGMVSEGNSKTSRIRFNDLTCENKKTPEECYEEIVTLPPLSSPKRSNMEFYVKRPKGAWFWTYDYYVDKEGNAYWNAGKTEINGRKFYWHDLRKKLPQNIEPSKLNVTIRPVRSGVVFKGKLYFDKISEKELQQLIWLFNAGEETEKLEDKTHGYKLGMAKPLGFGSIAIKADKVLLREILINSEEKTFSLQEKEAENKINSLCFDAEIIEQFDKATWFDAISNNPNALSNQEVCYPVAEKAASFEQSKQQFTENGYEWFAENHKGYNRKKQSVINMPNSRSNMIYCMYMEAMNPELKITDNAFQEREVSKKPFAQKNQDSKYKEKTFAKPVQNATFLRYSQKGNAIIRLEDGSDGQINVKALAGVTGMKANDKIKVQFLNDLNLSDNKVIHLYKLLK